MNWIRITEPSGSGFNLKRKAYHIAGLIVPVILYCDIFRFLYDDPFTTRKTLILLLLVASLSLAIMETLRMKNKAFRELFHRLFGALMKPSELNRVHGTVAYVMSNLLLMIFFSDEVVVIALTFLVLSDPLAAFVGIFAGRLRFWNGKTLEGTLAFVTGSFLSGIVFFMIQDGLGRGDVPFVLGSGSTWTVISILAFASICAGMAEFFSFTAVNGLIDDNLIIPIVAAVAIVIPVLILGFPASTVFLDFQRLL